MKCQKIKSIFRRQHNLLLKTIDQIPELCVQLRKLFMVHSLWPWSRLFCWHNLLSTKINKLESNSNIDEVNAFAYIWIGVRITNATQFFALIWRRDHCRPNHIAFFATILTDFWIYACWTIHFGDIVRRWLNLISFTR